MLLCGRFNEVKKRQRLEMTTTTEPFITSPFSLRTTKTSAVGNFSSEVLAPPVLSSRFIPLTQNVMDEVEAFIFFIGYPRSGHSIIGSFMDSHPNMIIAHEFPLFKTLARKRMTKYDIFNTLYRNSYDQLVNGWRGTMNVAKKGYSLSTKGLWQARFTKLKVIGNKHGGSAVQFFRTSPILFLSAMQNLRSVVNVPIRVIHVVRNPFDMIATQTLYMSTGIHGVKENASVTNKFNNTRLLMYYARDMLGRASAVSRMISVLNMSVLEIHNEDLIENPIAVMSSICKFVGVNCSNHFLQICKESTFSSPTKSRNTVVWPNGFIQLIQKRIKDYKFFQRYSFF